MKKRDRSMPEVITHLTSSGDETAENSRDIPVLLGLFNSMVSLV